MEAQIAPVDEARLEEFLGQAVTDMGAAMNGVLVMIGGELGLWKALDGAGPLTPAELGERTGVGERNVREWAAAQAASGYLAVQPGPGGAPLGGWRGRRRPRRLRPWGSTIATCDQGLFV